MEHAVPAVALLTEISINKTKQHHAVINILSAVWVCMYMCHTHAHVLVFKKHLRRSVSVMWRVTIHHHVSQPRADWRLIINANYNHRSSSELERIIAPLWRCASEDVCVSEGQRGSHQIPFVTSQHNYITGQVRWYKYWFICWEKKHPLFQWECQVRLIKVWYNHKST